MTAFAVIDTRSNEIIKTGRCVPGDLELQATEDYHVVVETNGLVSDSTHCWNPVAEEIVLKPPLTEQEQYDEQLPPFEQEIRDMLLNSDWTQLPDVSLQESVVEEWRVYRAGLREYDSSTLESLDYDLLPKPPGSPAYR